jgi:hypothetical protein
MGFMKMRKIFLYNAKTCIFQKEYEQDIKPRLSDKIAHLIKVFLSCCYINTNDGTGRMRSPLVGDSYNILCPIGSPTNTT